MNGDAFDPGSIRFGSVPGDVAGMVLQQAVAERAAASIMNQAGAPGTAEVEDGELDDETLPDADALTTEEQQQQQAAANTQAAYVAEVNAIDGSELAESAALRAASNTLGPAGLSRAETAVLARDSRTFRLRCLSAQAVIDTQRDNNEELSASNHELQKQLAERDQQLAEARAFMVNTVSTMTGLLGGGVGSSGGGGGAGSSRAAAGGGSSSGGGYSKRQGGGQQHAGAKKARFAEGKQQTEQITFRCDDGTTFQRSSHVRGFCASKQRMLCLRCYGKNHMWRECTEKVQPGNPPGFKP